jgi:hypothetical protein
MTLRVSVKNKDAQGRVLEITEETYDIGRPSPQGIVKNRLASGESREFHVHASKRLIVSEDPDSLRG